ncbi:MAG TPA: M56 family metallopeptidase, partial [Flavitalea sp.]|nr:M56 family metallopeptidase [Flavitalea sp.]
LRSAQLEDDQFVKLVPVFNTQGFDQNTLGQVSNFFWDVNDVVFAFFAAGIVVMLIRFIVQYFSVRSVRNASQLISAGDVNVYHVDKNIVPFSFGNSIFINKHKHSEDDLRNIIKHEFIHVKQKHTIDILWSELLCILNWYNPFAWLIRNAIRQNLEFIADSKVLQNGIDKKQYQYLLLKVVGVHQNDIATSFNFTSLKKRIAMMNKMRSAKLHVIKFLFVLPLLAVILLAFRDKVTGKTLHSESISRAFILIDQPSDDVLGVDTVPAPKKPTVRDRPPHIVRPNDKGYIITVADNHGECIVIIRDKTQKIVKALSLVEWDEKEKEYTSLYGEIPPPPSAKPPVPSPVPEAPAIPENISSIHVKDKKLTIVTNTGETEIYELDKPEQKASFQKKYGPVPASPRNPQSAPNPANQRQAPVIIDRKENKPTTLLPVERESDSILVAKIKRHDFVKVDNEAKVTIKTPEDFEGLIILNDKEYDRKSFEREVKLDANAIQYVEVYKNEKAVQLYGEKGKNGVIRIVTKI